MITGKGLRSLKNFHRKYNYKTQTIRVAIQQNKSCELWGRGAFGSSLPAALAYFGELPDNEQGTEFKTEVPYAKNGDPQWAYWYLPEIGGDARVQLKPSEGNDFACVPIEPLLNRYSCRKQN